MSNTILLILVSVALILVPSVRSMDQPEYTVTEFKPLPGGPGVRLLKINERGEIIAFAVDSLGRSHGFVYRNGSMQELFDPPLFGRPVDINNAGQILAYLELGEISRTMM